MLRTIAAAALYAVAMILPAWAQLPAYLVEGDRVDTIDGALRFCEDYPAECVGPPKPEVAKLTAAKFRELQSINSYVNKKVKYKTDTDHWGTQNRRYVVPVRGIDVVDRWSYTDDG